MESTHAERRGADWQRGLDPELLSPREVSERYGIAEQTLANWRSAGRGPKWTKVGQVGRPGGFVYYHPRDIEAHLAASVTTVDPAA